MELSKLRRKMERGRKKRKKKGKKNLRGSGNRSRSGNRAGSSTCRSRATRDSAGNARAHTRPNGKGRRRSKDIVNVANVNSLQRVTVAKRGTCQNKV